MALFKKNSNFLLRKFFQQNTKKGALESLEVKTLKISYNVWRKAEMKFLFCLTRILTKVKPYTHFKKIKLRGASIRIPFFILEKKRISIVLSWIRTNLKKGNFFSSLKSFFSESLKKGEDFKELKKSFHEVANKHKIFAHKRWF